MVDSMRNAMRERSSDEYPLFAECRRGVLTVKLSTLHAKPWLKTS